MSFLYGPKSLEGGSQVIGNSIKVRLQCIASALNKRINGILQVRHNTRQRIVKLWTGTL